MAKLHRDNAGYIGCSHEETQDPYYSYNKLALPLTESTDSVQRPAEVTHTVTVASGKFVIGGVSQASVSLIEGGTYKFDQSDYGNTGHPFRFSQTSNGTWNRGTEYTKGVSYVGTPGSSGAYTQLVVPFGGLDLFYYCGNHTNMGGSAATPANAGMATVGLPIHKTTDQVGKTINAGAGYNPDPFAANLILALTLHGTNGGSAFSDRSATIKGSGTNKSVSGGNVLTSTASSHYYGSSAYWDGTGDYMTIIAPSDFAFGTGDFTIEYWINTTDTDFNLMHPNGSTGAGFWGNIVQGSSFNWNNAYNSSNLWNVNASPILDGAWHHVAICKENGRFSVFFDGVSQPASGGTFRDGSDYSGSDSWRIGGGGNLSDFNGYLQDFRIYKGIAKYRPEGSGSLGMDVVHYIGTGATNTISSLSFKPDLIWIKGLATGSNTIQHVLQDTVRGTSALLSSQMGNREADFGTHWGYISSFNDDGFTLTAGAGGPDHNNHNGTAYAAWCWKAGGPATSVAANSLNSSVYDQRTLWRNAVSGTSAWNSNADLFNNSDTGTHAYSGNSQTFTTPSGYALSGTLEVHMARGTGAATAYGNYDVKVNGTSVFDHNKFPYNTNAIVNLGTFSNITSIEWGYGSNSTNDWIGLLDIRVNGKELVDSDITPTNVPLLDCSVSANDTHGFSITTWTGDGNNNKSVSHGLSTAPSWVFIKNRSATTSWHNFVRALDPNGRYQLYLDSTSAKVDFGTNFFNADSNVINLIGGSSAGINGNGADYVAYSWSEVPGYSKFSSYESNDPGGVVVTLGFRPRLVVIKSADYSAGTTSWMVYDSARLGDGVMNTPVMWNKSAPEGYRGDGTSSGAMYQQQITFTDTGFTVEGGGSEVNEQTGNTYIYGAWAESAPNDAGQDAFRTLATLDTKDHSSSAHTVTNNGASFQTSVKKFYDGAAKFNGSSSSLTIAGSAELAMGTGDFTYEMFIYQNNFTNRSTFFDNRSDSSTTGITVGTEQTNGQIRVYMNATNGSDIAVTGPTMLLNQWVHIAVCRNGGTVTLFVNGSPSAAGTRTSDLNNPTHNIAFGYTPRPGGTSYSYLDGYMQDIRVYKGLAKYTSSFSPPERSIQGTARRYPSGVYVVS